MSDVRTVIVGAGSVGATLAYACLIRGVGGDIVLYGTDAAKVEGQVLDLRLGLGFVPAATVRGSADLDECRDSDVMVITAGASQRTGQTRLDLVSPNTSMLGERVPALLDRSPEALLLVVTNPVDVLTWVALRLFGLPAGRVLGSGTVLDSPGCASCSPIAAVSPWPMSMPTSPASTATPRSPFGPPRASPTHRCARGDQPTGNHSMTRSSTTSSTRCAALHTGSSRATGQPTSPSASPASGSSRRSNVTSGERCR